MKTMSSVLVVLCALALAAAAPVCRAMGGHASATINQIDDLDRAKMDKEESKRKKDQADQQDQQDANPDGSSQCGTVSIGNSNSNQTGSGRVVPHDTTVIVTGNVYNTANCGH